MKNCNLGIIGCGNMAQAVIESIYAGGMTAYEKSSGLKLSVTVSDPDDEKLLAASKKFDGISIAGGNKELVDSCEYILLAVKPQVYSDALKGISFENKRGKSRAGNAQP